MNYKEIFGCAAFGLADQVFHVECQANDPCFYLADAVLPAHPSGKIHTGATAEEERIHSGLSWPPEARVRQGTSLRRAPIPCIWHGLVEAGDRTARWQVGRGVSFTLSRILSVHIAVLLNNSGCKPQDTAVVAIPDALDEFGQEALLRDLKLCGFEHVQLLWRPVAAALSWISELDQNNAFTEDTDAKEHIIVVYLGPDCVEMATFRLHREKDECHNAVFVIPVRERPQHIASITGFDWAANVIDATYPRIDDGAFWQAFTKFPHVWEAISDKSFSSKKDEIWSQENLWTLWRPSNSLKEIAQRTSAAPNNRLRALLANSCRLFEAYSGKKNDSAEKHLNELFVSVLNSRPRSRLRGVVVTGPLCPPRLPQWIQSVTSKLKALGITSTSAYPQIDSIWLAHKENALADGCAEYGRRLDMEPPIPTYLDTLPQLSVLVEQRGNHIWVDLLNAETCKGGRPYQPDPIQGKFAIQAGAKNLQVYLKKGNTRGRVDLNASEEFIEGGAALSASKRGEIDTKVRQAGTYENVLKIFTNKDVETGKYARKQARELFGNPFRRAEFLFPSVPDKNMPVDVSVEIRPASGLAQITLAPSNPEDTLFLRGQQIFLDYSTMEETDPPPPPSRGWPDVIKFKVDSMASFLRNHKYVIREYLRTEPGSHNFMILVDNVKNALAPPTNNFIHPRPIDQNGMAGTEEATRKVDALAGKAAKDFQYIQHTDAWHFVIRMSWFFAKTPENVRQKIRDHISQGHYDQNWIYGVEAAGRVFVDKKDFLILYEAILTRINSNHKNPFPIHSLRALWRLLSLRGESPIAMTRPQAETFTIETVKIMRQEAHAGNYEKKFFQAAGLFLFLLRFRVVDPKFLDPDNPLDRDLFNLTLDCLKKAQNHFSQCRYFGGDRARQLVIGIEKFMRYEGSNDILTVLDDLTGGN